MASEGLTDSQPSLLRPDRAKAYNRVKIAASIVSSALSFALLVVLVVTDASRTIAAWCVSVTSGDYGALILFALAVGAIQSAVTLSLGWFSSYYSEHAFGLSNQSLGRWAWEHMKGIVIRFPLVISLLCILYFCLKTFGIVWWLPVSIVTTLLTMVLARLAPVLILPLFYRFTPIADGSLKERITHLCTQAGVHIEGIFSFNLSKNTKKANAAFTGIGRAKRIILGDTLVREFSEEEIETVFAHELGHHHLGHIRTGILIGTISTFLGLYVAARLYDWSLHVLAFSSPADLGALPILALWLSILGLLTAPIGNMISRRHERQADLYAVTTTGKRVAFASALHKLAAMNLADADPHPLVEFLLYSHPSITKRIRAIEQVEH